jgi:hypothetical protein
MNEGAQLDTLMIVLPFILAAVLVGFGLAGTVTPPPVKAWMRRWIFRPFAFLVWIGWVTYVLITLALQPTRPMSWVLLALAAVFSWQIFKGRQAAAKSHPEMGTSE